MQSPTNNNHAKKVLFVITKSNFGGAQKYVYELATSLDSSKFDVSVALGGNGILKDKLESSNITTISIPHLKRDISLLKECKVFHFLYSLYKREMYDAVHLNSSKIGGIGSLAARFAGIKKIIFTAHGWAFNENRSFLSKQLIKISYYVTILCSSKTIAVSKNLKEQISNWPFIQNKIICIHNGVAPVVFYQKNEALEKLNLSPPKGAVLIGALSELHKIKGLDILLHSIKSLTNEYSNIHLCIFGEGEERVNLETQIKKLQLENFVTLLGYVDNAPKYLKALDIFVLPSRSEALSLAILEAGLAKLPVVATRVGGIPEIITTNENGFLVEKENIQALTDALSKMIRNERYRNTSSLLLHKKVTQHFSQDEMIDRTQALY